MNSITKKQYDTIYLKILRYILKDQTLKPEINPKAYILGGQPGAGKSRLNKQLQKKHQGNIIIINADQYRKYHPDYPKIKENKKIQTARYTSDFSSQITQDLIEDLSKRKYNLTIEGTLRTAKVPINTCKMLKGKGYTVELDIMATKEKISYLSTILRYYKALHYNETARFPDKNHHNQVLENISKNLNQIYEEHIFDQINIYNRQLEKINNQDAKEKPGDTLEKFYKASYTKKENQDLKELVEKLNQLTGENYNNYLN